MSMKAVSGASSQSAIAIEMKTKDVWGAWDCEIYWRATKWSGRHWSILMKFEALLQERISAFVWSTLA